MMHILASCNQLAIVFLLFTEWAFVCMQKLQRVDTGVIAPPPPSAPALPPSAPALPPPSASAPPSASFDEVDELEKQLVKAKRIAELKRELAEAQEDPPPRSTWF